MTGRPRATVFGEVAEVYDRARPGYPPAFVDDVLGAVAPPHRMLEAGAGTGKGTVAFAERGATIVAYEPDARMAAVCRRNTAAQAVEVRVGRFEDARVDAGGFTHGFSTQAWHWVEPETGAALMAAALRSGAALALAWNVPDRDDSALRADIDAVYRRRAPHLAETSLVNRWLPVDESHYAPLLHRCRFEDLGRRAYRWTRAYTTPEYAELLQTHSDHVLLGESERARLVGDVAAAIDAHGGIFEYPYVTDLRLFRRR